MKSVGAERRPQANIPLARLTTLGVGGPARWYAWATRAGDVDAYAAWAAKEGLALTALGGGSNVVIADRGIDGLVLQIDLRGASIEPAGDTVRLTAGAGESWDDVVAMSVALGLGGLECLSGIPGRVGGTPIQNVGAYGQEVADVLETVTAFDCESNTMITLTAAECGFAYRSSRFKGPDAGRFLVCEVAFRLRRTCEAPAYPELRDELARVVGGVSPTPLGVRNAVLRLRRRKGMVLNPEDSDTRSVGSFFMNPLLSLAERDRVAGVAGEEPPSFAAPEQTGAGPRASARKTSEVGRVKVPAAWLIERAGFAKSFEDGPVGISSKHTLAIINRGGATATDVIRLAARIKQGVVDRFGVVLRPEPVFLGFENDPGVTFLQKANG
jgi:UDP-N-acetylmuramate dehydrogenase